ncbi:DUF2231 domain-containing protein [Thalassospira alkalitolerans]|uniref:DUF2231 domain-containing protein n=2 Tax=Alphaproteobacteria TaxID=28211 RepID=UPI003AA9154E
MALSGTCEAVRCCGVSNTFECCDLMARHPLHLAIVHFPIACWSLAVAADVASLWLDEAAWQWPCGLLVVGIVTAVLAIAAGLFELRLIADGPAIRDTWRHMVAMLLAFSFLPARLLMRLDHLQPLAPDKLSFILGAFGLVSLAIGGWLGGKLVCHHRIGGDRT